MDLGIAGKKALVCGASAGLGYACAQALVREGVDVLIVARTEAPLLAAAERLRQEGAGSVQCVAADVTTEAGRAKIFEVQQDFDMVVTNAGGPPPGDFRHWDRDIWVRAIEANMLAPIELIKATVDGMAARGFGRIVNIGSVSGLSGNAGQANYAAAKAGLVGFTKTIAKEMGAKGITANVVAPGFIETDMTHVLGDAVKTAFLQNIPVRRLGKPEEIAAAVAYVSSDEAGFLTSQTIVVDGGMVGGRMWTPHQEGVKAMRQAFGVDEV